MDRLDSTKLVSKGLRKSQQGYEHPQRRGDHVQKTLKILKG